MPSTNIKTGSTKTGIAPISKNTVASGSYGKSSSLVKSELATIPITKNSQFAGSSANVIWSQPMFFSPMHTPQNWQIASKRREIYMWSRFYYCFTPENMVLMADGAEKKICDIKMGDEVINGMGEKGRVLSVHTRSISEDVLKIQINGEDKEIVCTEGHEIPRVEKEEYGKNNFKEEWKSAKTLNVGDMLFCFNNSESKEKSFVAVTSIKEEFYSGVVYDLEVEGVHSYCVNRCVVHNSNEAKVAAGVDFYCFDPNAQVLMENGVQKSISSIKEGDFVRSHDGSANIVEKVHKREASEKMLSIRVAGVSMGGMKVTGGHDLLTERDGEIKFVKAEELSIGDYLLTPCNYDNENKYVVENDFAWLVGVYAAEGCGLPYEHKSKGGFNSQYFNGVVFTISMTEKDTLAKEIKQKVQKVYPGKKVTIREVPDAGRIEVKVFGQDIADDLIGHSPGTAKYGDKKFINVVLKWTNENLKHLLSGYFAGDGCFNAQNGFQGVGVARKMMDQLANICDRLGVEYSFTKTRLDKWNRQTIYNLRISRRSCGIFENINSKYYDNTVDTSKIRNTPYFAKGNYIYRKILGIKSYYYSGDVYDLTIANKSSYVVHRVAVHNSNFSMNGFKLECKKRKILKHFERVVDKLNLAEKLNEISHEYFLIGDVFPFLDIECESCKGKGYLPNGQKCNHPDGTFKSVKILNPDYVDVMSNGVTNTTKYFLKPDEELRGLVARRDPIEIYNSLSPELVRLISSGQNIPLSDRCISHIRHNASAYGTYGSPMLQRLFTILAYKTKIMTANWIVAERLILPIRIVKVGDKDRPASEEDLLGVVNQLSVVANDPNQTIVTHHAFEMTWEGATGKIHNITPELENIGKEILDGLMLNQALLNGEASCHDEETLTLTDSGFKKHDEIIESDKIACYNPDTKSVEYHNYKNKFVYDYDGEMIHFNTNRIDIMVTPNHRMYCRKRDHKEFEIIEAKDVKRRSSFLGRIENFCEEDYIKEIKIGSQTYSIYDYCEMVGFYVSEGSSGFERRKNRSACNRATTLNIHQSRNGRAREQISSLFKRMFKTNYESENSVSVYNMDLTEYLRENFGSHSYVKKLSPFVKNLPKECLEIILNAMIEGDGAYTEETKDKYSTYHTASKDLAQDFAEIAFKCGYSVIIRKKKPRVLKKRYFNKRGHEFITRKWGYIVYISKGRKGEFPQLDSRDKEFYKNEIKKIDYKGKVYCFEVPYGLFVTMRNGMISIQGNSYSSAQVGVEVLIRRLDNWRNKLAKWVEQHIFLPIAMMQGFVDEKDSEDLGETVYIYPKLIWNDLQLRDKTNRIQTLVQLHEKKLVSGQTILEELDLDYDSELEKIRDEEVLAQQNGMLPPDGGMGGMGGGGMPPMGGMGGGGEMGGAPGLGGEMGGMPGGMEMGGAPGGDMGAAGMGAAADSLPKITKRGKKQEEQRPPMPKLIKFTKLEQQMYKILKGIPVNYNLFAQYAVRLPGEQRPFMLDFAYPQIGLCCESDGKLWHEREDFKQRDSIRDQKLSKVGWRILRFSEEAVEEHSDAVRDIVIKNMKEAVQFLKKSYDEGEMTKYASDEEDNFIYKYMENEKVDSIAMNIEDMPNNLGYIINIGID